jgi:hypothetical protein
MIGKSLNFFIPSFFGSGRKNAVYAQITFTRDSHSGPFQVGILLPPGFGAYSYSRFPAQIGYRS